MRRMSGRLARGLLALWFLVFSLVSLRLVQVQVGASDRYVSIGNKQRIRLERQLAVRGTIFDRDGVALAMSVPRFAVIANPTQIDDGDTAAYARALAPDRKSVV